MNHTTISGIDVFPMAVPPNGFGADAKNTNPVYSSVVLKIKTTDPQLTGDSFVFTIGAGLMEMCDMVRSTAFRFLLNRETPISVEELSKDGNLGEFSRAMLSDCFYNWLGGAGMSRMAIGAVNNALWDLCAKSDKTTGWEFLARKTPQSLLHFIDFEHIGDFLSPAEALQMLREAQTGKQERIAKLYHEGPLAYNTAGWSGISTETLAAKTKDMQERKWGQIKVKVGALFPTHGMEVSLQDDIARLTRVFDTIRESGGSMKVAVDSNQIFNVNDAVEFISRLAIALHSAGQAKGANYQLTWFEEPTNPIDSQGHLMIRYRLQETFKSMGHPDITVPIATGEHCPSPVIFKNLVKGIPECGVKPIEVIQLDYSRMGGVGDSLASMMMARKAGVNVCPHAGGVGLCEGVVNVQALKEALFGTRPGEVLEFVEGGLHEGVYEYPASVKDSRYVMHRGAIGNGTAMTAEGEREYRLPEGRQWLTAPNKKLAQQLTAK